jgi:hypothetical protein
VGTTLEKIGHRHEKVMQQRIDRIMAVLPSLQAVRYQEAAPEFIYPFALAFRVPLVASFSLRFHFNEQPVTQTPLYAISFFCG